MLTIDEIVSARTDLLTFSKLIYKANHGVEMKDAPHMHVICEALEKVVIGRIKRLIINVPPRSGKTHLAVINFIAWGVGNFPDAEFIHASYSKRLASSNTYNARALIKSERYGEIFPEISISTDSSARDEFRTDQGGIVYATGADGAITGYGAGKMRSSFGGCILIDDPHKAGEANSRLMRENVRNWFSVTLESRKNSPDTPIIIIMQRLHTEDLSGWLLGGGNGEKWASINIPAIQDDQSFWPEQFPINDLMRMKEEKPWVFSSQYMQNPIITGGNIIKGEWFLRYKEVPLMAWRAIYADTAQKTAEHNDYSVFQCWGRGEDGRAYLLDQIRGKWEAPELERRAVAFWSKMISDESSALRYMAIEDKASGTGLIQKFQREAMIPVKAIQRNKDKFVRVNDVLGYIESGYVGIPENSPFVNDFVVECEEFTATDTHTHDDQIDPMLDAILDMIDRRKSSLYDHI